MTSCDGTRSRDRTLRVHERSIAWCSVVATLFVAVASLVPSVARAQAATALDHFDPAPAGDAMLWVPSASAPGRVRTSFGIIGEYAHQPLVLSFVGNHDTARTVVGHQLTLHLLASVHLVDRVAIDVAEPFTLHQSGDDPAATSFPSPHGAAAGDLRIGARVTVLQQKGFWPAASIGATVWLPTGNKNAYAGTGVTRFAPTIAFGAEGDHYVWGASASRHFDPGGELIGSDITFLAGAAGRFSVFQIGPELAFSTITDSADDHAFARRTTSFEAVAMARAHVSVVELSLGGGPGFGRAPGTPAVRVLAGVEVRLDAVKATPNDHGGNRNGDAHSGLPTRNAGADPTIDTDGDGVDDAHDQCKTVVGQKDGAHPGCPLDTDGDGLPDAVDPCPKEAGPILGDPAHDGCPLDTDGDGIKDPLDACPRDKGPHTSDPTTNGCPTSLRVGEGEIALLVPLRFKSASAEIDPASFPILEEIATALKQNPAIARVAVDGHTDNRGAPGANVLLSQKRALAVVSWLTDHGIDPRRTEARGFGPRQPIDDNTTDAGRAKNRRVELVILRRTPDGESGWQDGTVERNVDAKTPKGAP